MSRVASLKQLLAGRWQLPAAVVALVALGTALYRVAPPPREVHIDSLLAEVHTLLDADEFRDAANSVANLLTMQPAPKPADAARLHLLMAEIIHRQEKLRTPPIRENYRRLVAHTMEAEKLGARRDGRSAMRLAAANEWLGKPDDAITYFKEALDHAPPSDVRLASLRALIRLCEGMEAMSEERRDWIEALLSDEFAEPAALWWTMRRALREAVNTDDLPRARALVVAHADAFKRSDLLGYHYYLWAWVEIADGRCEAAAPLIDAAAGWVNQSAALDAEMDAAGLLPVLVHVLRGDLALCEDRPQEALDHFEEAAGMQDFGDDFVDAEIGRMRALAMLGRHDAASAAPAPVLAALGEDLPARLAAERRFRAAATRLHDVFADRGQVEAAVEYLTLAASLSESADAETRSKLFEQLGKTLLTAVPQRDPEGARQGNAHAGRAFETAATLCDSEDARFATLLWSAADAFDDAGLVGDEYRPLLAFVQHRLADARLPVALLRLGRVSAVSGRLDEAITWYRRLTEEFPMLEEGATARFLTAEALIALDSADTGEPESLLLGLLRDDRVEPDARVFRDALFALCDLYYEAGRATEAISRIEDFLAFYPEDDERVHLRFLLADAYRRSAETLSATETSDPSVATDSEASRRLTRAGDLFLTLAAELGVTGDDPEPEDSSAATYGRLALRCAADCLYERNTPETLDTALGLYRQIAARYQAHPDCLSAQVQIANIHLRSGRRIEAARAVERAQWMLSGIPPAAFAPDDALPGRADWEQYLTTLRSSNLFEDVFARSP